MQANNNDTINPFYFFFYFFFIFEKTHKIKLIQIVDYESVWLGVIRA